MRKHLHHLSRLVFVFVSAVVLVAQTQHITPFTGTWKLNVAKSKYSPGPGLKSETVTIAPDGKTTVEAVGALGKSLQWSYPWSDGAEVLIDGIQRRELFAQNSHTDLNLRRLSPLCG